MIYINQNTDSQNLTEMLAKLPEWRRKQALQFRHEQGQRLCAAVYLLLCEGLKKEYNISTQPSFAINKNGKPALIDYPHIHFNFSHSHNAAICAIDTQPVGIDIELIRPIKQDLTEYTMNKQEIKGIKTPQDFFRLWTMKEAYLKLTGEGIHSNMQDILSNIQSIVFQTTITTGNYIYTLASEKK